MDFKEIYDSHLALGTDFEVGGIKIRMPTIKEIIEFGEKRYFGIVYIFASTSSDYKAQLDDAGLNWEDVSDYDMFLRLFPVIREEDTSILFGNSDMKGFLLAKDNNTGQIIYHNPKTDAKIDRTVYECMSGYICAMHNIEKVHEKAANAYTRKVMLMESRDKMEGTITKQYKSQFRNLAIAMANTPEFKSNYFETLDYPISIFMDCVKQVQQLKHFNYVMHGIYAGTVDSKKIPKAELTWIKQLNYFIFSIF